MSLNNNLYKKLTFSEKQLEIIYNTVGDLSRGIGNYYASYVYEDTTTGCRLGFTSNPDWQSEYIGNKLIEDCHLWQTVVKQFLDTKRPFFILPWSTSSPSNQLQKDIFLFRQEKYIGEGISFCFQNQYAREYFALASELNDHGFLKHLSKNMDLVKSHLESIQKIRAKCFKIHEGKKHG